MEGYLGTIIFLSVLVLLVLIFPIYVTRKLLKDYGDKKVSKYVLATVGIIFILVSLYFGNVSYQNGFNDYGKEYPYTIIIFLVYLAVSSIPFAISGIILIVRSIKKIPN